MIDYILGDLHEEFLILREQRGAPKAGLWYARQLLLSLPAMLKPADLLLAMPLLLLDRLWCFIYSMIPLKDGLDRAPGFLIANILCACTCVAIVRPPSSVAIAATVIALSLTVSAEPTWYIGIILIAVLLTARLRRRHHEVA